MELNCSATSNTEAYYNESGDTVTYTFGGKFVKWTAGLIWGRHADPMYLNSFGAWVPASTHSNFVTPYDHREGKHFLKIFRHSAIQTGERH